MIYWIVSEYYPWPLSEGNSLLHYRTSNDIAKSIFLLSVKKTVNDITVNTRKATQKKKKKENFFFVFQVLSMHSKALACWTERTSGARPARVRRGPELSDSPFQTGDTESVQHSSWGDHRVTYQFCPLGYHLRHLKKRPDWYDKYTQNEETQTAMWRYSW